MRDREQILDTLERAYREAFTHAGESGDETARTRLDFDFQRDQVWLEVLLDLRDLLAGPLGDDPESKESLLDKARALRDLTRLR
jgi:hypothetical protein